MKNTILALSLVFAFGAANAAPTNAISNGSFESSNVVTGDYSYADAIPGHVAVTASPWKFTGGAGVATNGSDWGGTALDGSRFAFLQMAGGTVSQSFSGGSGQYTIDFSLAQRMREVAGYQKITVSFDGQLLSNQSSTAIRPSTIGDNEETGGWTSYTFQLNSVAAGNHTLTFAGLGSLDSLGHARDTSVFLDKVSVAAPVPEPETYAMLLAGLGLMGTIAARRKPKQA